MGTATRRSWSLKTPICAAVLAGGGKKPDRKSTRLNSSHDQTSYAVFCFEQHSYALLLFGLAVGLRRPPRLLVLFLFRQARDADDFLTVREVDEAHALGVAADDVDAFDER